MVFSEHCLPRICCSTVECLNAKSNLQRVDEGVGTGMGGGVAAVVGSGVGVGS